MATVRESGAWYRREKTVDSEGIGIELEARAKAMGADHARHGAVTRATSG